MKPRRLLLAVLASGLALLGACGSSDEPMAAQASANNGDAATGLTGTVTVSAAASLTEAFEEIGADFETENPGTNVKLNFDSSSTLAAQIIDGAPADVFASADLTSSEKVTDAKLSTEPLIFAYNRLSIATKHGNPIEVTGLSALEDLDVVALCSLDSPCGKYAEQVLKQAGVSLDESNVTRGQNASATLSAVSEGDADAGIVYHSDIVRSLGSVDEIEISKAENVMAKYFISGVGAAKDEMLVSSFVEFVLQGPAQSILKRYGFGEI